MQTENPFKNPQITIFGLLLAAGIVASSLIISKTLIDVKKMGQEVISVTGSAEQNIVSDYAVWRAEFWRRDPLLPAAFGLVRDDLKKVREYLVSKGIREEEIVAAQASTSTFYRKNEKGSDTNDVEGYHITQVIEVRTADVDAVTRVSRESTELIDQGIQFSSQSPEYFYTKLGDLKVEMLAKATGNAKLRAEKMAGSAGNAIGLMRSARMGVFQITPVNSLEVSDWGVNDTSSLEKKVTAVVNVSFSIKGA